MKTPMSQFASMAEKRRFDMGVKERVVRRQMGARNAFHEADWHRAQGFVKRAEQWQERMATLHKDITADMNMLL